jgi:putative transposase
MITVCQGHISLRLSWLRMCLFGECVDGEVRLNSTGNVIHSEWDRLASHFPNIQLEAFIVMPNHVHGIIIIESPLLVEATRPWVDEILDDHIPTEIELKDHRNGSPQQQRNRPMTVGATRPWVDRIMDNHESMVKELKNSRDGSPLPKIAPLNGPIPGLLGAMIGQFKSRATKRIWALPGTDRQPIWQRNYYDHIIRSEKALENIRAYIMGNPIKWAEDEYFSDF